ncbi:hypothetical protein chiPu_0014190 [Chiloscyllium punctatum]|uniref:Uncharacterized protein n=1 Tax=Chiloscyllium punctatum TaxID=137246 RepID=A0A401SZ75_CHIPU|nr:hypothetical protein [Chiloscyllium punctatum]
MELQGKVALVTGAAQGIGKAIAEILLKNGAKVSLLDINASRGEATKAAFGQTYGAENILFLPCDVTSENQLKDCFSKTVEKFQRLDIVCNNAGIFDEKNWENCLSINLLTCLEKHGVRLQALCPVFVDTKILTDLKSVKSPDHKEKLEMMIANLGVLKPTHIAEGFLQLVRDQTRNGASLKVLENGKLEYEAIPTILPENPKSI